MPKKGCYYLWNIVKTSDFGYSITQLQTFEVKLAETDCIAAYECGRFTSRGWFPQPRWRNELEYTKTIPTPKNFSVEEQLKKVEKQVEEEIPSYILSESLKPLEKIKYWTEDLQNLLNGYFRKEKNRYKQYQKKKCNNILKTLKENPEKIKVSLKERRYATCYLLEIKTNSQKLQNWFVSKLLTKKMGRTGRKFEIPTRDVVLHYPLFRELITKTTVFDKDRYPERRRYRTRYYHRGTASPNILYNQITDFWGGN